MWTIIGGRVLKTGRFTITTVIDRHSRLLVIFFISRESLSSQKHSTTEVAKSDIEHAKPVVSSKAHPIYPTLYTKVKACAFV